MLQLSTCGSLPLGTRTRGSLRLRFCVGIDVAEKSHAESDQGNRQQHRPDCRQGGPDGTGTLYPDQHMYEKAARLEQNANEEGKAEPELPRVGVIAALSEQEEHEGKDEEHAGMTMARPKILLLERGQRSPPREKSE